ncbi:MAG: potassium transporter TrkH, partial [Rhodobacterales bacterium]
MFDRIARLPLLVILMGIGVLAMIVPGLYGFWANEHYAGRVFLYSALLFGFVTGFIALAMAGRARGNHPSRHLLALLGLFVILPLVLAVPFHQALGNTSYLNAYVEMVSALTTTGATLFDDPGRLPDTLHLWRALVGWLGGLFIWVGAIAILAPMALGGFEVRAHRIWNAGAHHTSQITHVADLSQRIRVYGAQLLPLYGGLTAILWLGLILAGDHPFVALCHAMSTMATSGISPVGGPAGGGAGLGGEVMIALFLGFGLSRLTFTRDGMSSDLTNLARDPEVRLALVLILVVPGFLFARHWLGAYEVDQEMDLLAGLASLWGSLFTVLSFLTTNGFESRAWEASQAWSGLHTPGLILMGLALIGGGVATTAGGAK